MSLVKCLRAILVIACINLVAAEMDLFLTMQSAFDKIRDGANSIIQCTPTRHNPDDIVFGRELNTGQGIDLTNNSVFWSNPSNNASTMTLPAEDGAERFGVYYCEETVANITTKITTMKLPFDDQADISPEQQYKTATTGDDVIIKMEVGNNQSLPILWRFNEEEKPEWKDQLEVTIKNVNKAHEGIYECYYEGRQHLGYHALTRLTVSRCHENKWGELCDKDCPPCYNGGVCHEDVGRCVCPPGFSGDNCGKPCGGNSFGTKCERKCDPENADDDDACAVMLMCLPDPYGCSCASGFTGPQCSDDCEPGKFGAGCTQTCHCKDGPDDCDRITGTCATGCAFGWTGETCQIPGALAPSHSFSCPVGKFGMPACEEECHCSAGEACEAISGKCPTECVDGWTKESCSECLPGRFGDSCNNICHCIDGPKACNSSSGECAGDCEPGYVGVNCQEECPPQTYGLNCSYTCACQNRGRCDPFNGTCECTGKWRGENCTEVAPEIISAPNIEVNAGIQANILCTVLANPQPQIKISSTELPELVTDVSPQNESIHFANISYISDKAAKYKLNCSAHNDHGTDEATFTLQVIAPPVLRNSPEIREIGDTTVSLSWKSWLYGSDQGGKPSDKVEYMVYVWLEDYEEWTPAGNWKEATGAKITGLSPDTNYKFAIQSRRPGEGGEGQLSANVTAKTNCSKADEHEVFPKDFRIKEVTNSHIHIDWKEPEHDDLKCTLKNYLLRIWPESNSSNVQEVDLRSGLTEYVVTNVNSETLYIIEMKVFTFITSAGKAASLNVTTLKAVVGPVENLEFTYGTLPRQVNLKWEEPKDKKADIKKYLISAKLTNIGQCGKKFGGFNITNQETTDTQATVTNLQPNSEYEISVQAQTPIGQGEVSMVSMSTKEDAPAAPPANLRAAKIEKTMIEFVWDSVPCDKANGIIITYEYSMKHKRSPRNKRSEDWFIPPTKINDTSVSINGLTPFAKYGFALRAFTKVGPGPLSEELILRTQDDTPPPPLMEFIDSSATSLTVQISKSRRPHSAILQYMIQCTYDNNDTQTITVNITDDTQPIQYTIKGLNPYTPYTLQVAAKTAVDWSEPCEPQIAWTKEIGPSPPRDLHLDSAEENALRISWSPPEKPNGILIGYTIEYRLENTKEKDDVIESDQRYLKFPVDNSTLSIPLLNLVSDSDYEVSIIATNRIGDSLEIKRTFRTRGKDNAVPKTAVIETPRPPTIHEKKENAIYITVHQSPSKPRAYQVIVENADNNEIVDDDDLTDYETAAADGRDYYIAAEIEADQVPSEGYRILVGDDQTYGKYKNPPLDPNKKYLISVRTVHGDGSIFSHLAQNYDPVEVSGTRPVLPLFEVIEDEEKGVYIKILRTKTGEQPKAYQVIIEEQTNTAEIDTSKLSNYSIADDLGHPYYITAEIDAANVSEDGYTLLLGDGKHYGEFSNVPLNEDKKYRYHVRTVNADGRSFSPLSSALNVGETQSKKDCFIWGMGCPWFLVLVVGLAVLILLILAAAILCTRRRRRSRSHRISQKEKSETQSMTGSIIRRTSKNQTSSSRTYTASYRLSKVEVDAQNGTVTNDVTQEKRESNVQTNESR